MGNSSYLSKERQAFPMKYIQTCKQNLCQGISRNGEFPFRELIVIFLFYIVSLRLQFLVMADFKNYRHYVAVDDWPKFWGSWYFVKGPYQVWNPWVANLQSTWLCKLHLYYFLHRFVPLRNNSYPNKWVHFWIFTIIWLQLLLRRLQM